MKPSHLYLDEGRMVGARLVDPKAIMGRYATLKAKEVLQPPHIWEYNDKAISPHYTKTTQNLQVCVCVCVWREGGGWRSSWAVNVGW